jgi:CheY-like chemotaxis protein
VDPDQTLSFAQELAQLRREGRMLRKRIEERGGVHTVIVADDDPFMRALIMATLSPESYDVLEAGTGSYALEMVREYHPTLVILDQRMPDPDGFTVCKEIKGDPELQDILVIMVTANPDDEPQARAAGADRYLSKPFRPLALLSTIDQLVADR